VSIAPELLPLRLELARCVRKLRRVLAGQSERYREATAQHLPEGTCVSRPQGAFVFCTEQRDRSNAVDLQLRARASASRTASSSAPDTPDHRASSA